MSEPLHDLVVAALGRDYQLEGEIGRGGMSVVYRARDLRLNRTVAVKVLPPELAYDVATRTRFTREAQTSAQLSHAHIVPIFDVGERDGIAYFVMALVTGGNLGSLLAHEPRQPVDEVHRLLREIADGLAFAHLRGVIHRDIKPDNILLDGESGRAMVTDFGIAQAIEAGTRLTVTGIAVGTPAYMSPEQAMGERQVDGRSDIYSLGVVAYQMLTGRLPFTAGNSMALLMKHVTEPPRPIAELRPDAPRALCDAVERALSKQPEDRWPTAAALRDAFGSGDVPGATWRAERREAVRYASPRPESARRRGASGERPRVEAAAASRRDAPAAEPSDAAPASARRPDEIVLEPPHLAPLTPPQRQDLRLWHGRVHLLDRIRAMRGYALTTAAAAILSVFGVAFGAEVPPLVLAPLVPGFMMRKLWLRGRSLRASGLRLRRVLFMPTARRALPPPPPVPPVPTARQLGRLASREVLETPQGAAIRRAAEDRAAILAIVASLPKPDRALLPDVASTVKALVERVAHLAQALHRLDESIDPRQIAELDARIADVEAASDSPDGQRRLALFRRQRGTLQELARHRAALLHQLESAGLALGNLRLDLVRFRSSGGQAALADVSTATQEARALSRDIGVMLEAAAEVKEL